MNKKENDILDLAIKTVSTTTKLSNRLNFKGNYAMPGKEIAEQIMKISASIPA